MFDDFFIRALAAGLGIAFVTGPLGCFVIWRRLSYFGDTLAHSALLGVTLAYTMEFNIAISVFIISSLIALILIQLQKRTNLPGDALLGLLAHSSLAIGLVVVGFLTDNGEEQLFHMDDLDDNLYSITRVRSNIQELLDQATILIGHNIVHDLMWLWECNLNYDGPIFDTMLGEYILQRGLKEPLSLEACANRYDLVTKKQDTMKEYFKNKVPVDEIPRQELSDYLSADLKATQELADEFVGGHDDKKILNIEFLKGEAIRCKDYCDVAEFCDQYKRENL